MIQRLVILGALKQKSASGYDIKKFIEKDLKIFSKLETKSIYYSLKKMEREGLIAKKKTKGAGRYPEKFMYSLLPSGEKEFITLCRQVMLSQQRPFIDLDIALYFLPFLDQDKIIPLLRLRLRFLEKVKHWLGSKEDQFKDSPENLQLLIAHHSALAAAEKDFVEKMITVVKEKKIKA